MRHSVGSIKKYKRASNGFWRLERVKHLQNGVYFSVVNPFELVYL